VSEKHYDEGNEKQWFEAALLQVRASGSQSFPSVKWIAVAIRNVEEHKGADSFEPSFKVGAIFDATEVFDLEQKPQDLIVRAHVDRHPFTYNPQGKPEQRWRIVENHAATNHPSASPQQQR